MPYHSKYTRARDGQEIVSSKYLREVRRVSENPGKAQRKMNNAHRRHRKGIDKSNIHWTDKPTRKDIEQHKQEIGYGKTKKSGWLW